MNIYKLIILAVMMLLIAPGVGAKEKKAEPVTVQLTEITPAPVATDVQPEQLAKEPATKEANAGEEINWQVISSGGDIGGSSPNYFLSGTTGQTAVGGGSSPSYGLGHGFWGGSSGDPTECDCLPGDANGDGQINVGDAVYIIAYVFQGGPPPTPYAICSGDANCDCQCNVGDAVYLIAYVFQGGPAPCSCEGWLGLCGPPLRD